MTLLLSKLRTTNFYLVWTNLKRYVTLSGVEAQLTNLLQFDILMIFIYLLDLNILLLRSE